MPDRSNRANATPPDHVDLDLAGRWWAELAPTIPHSRKGLWFGVVELDRSGSPSVELYVAGAASPDPDDSTGDWACDPTWLVDAGYVSIPGLTAIDRTDFPAQLSFALEIVSALAPQSGGLLAIDVIAVGFDDGDFEIVYVNPSHSTEASGEATVGAEDAGDFYEVWTGGRSRDVRAATGGIENAQSRMLLTPARIEEWVEPRLDIDIEEPWDYLVTDFGFLFEPISIGRRRQPLS